MTMFWFAATIRVQGSRVHGAAVSVGAGGSTSDEAANHVRALLVAQGFEVISLSM